jgi:hypothetical protein
MMNKPLKITLNTLLFLLIAGFGYYMFHSILSEKKNISSETENPDNSCVSPFKKTVSFNTPSNILCFDVYNNSIYIAQIEEISVFDLSGKPQFNFQIEANARDIIVEREIIYLLYPTKIELYTPEGVKKEEWEACSENSDYCAFTTTQEYVFVTDTENKLIHQYNKQGGFVRFIKSPEGFVIPGYSFDIISINDTIYCSNSGRHQIESYTTNGEFIASFGVAGTEAGACAGCCNPVYLAKNAAGDILTSEKGNPRISCFGRDGNFRSVLFDSHTLGGGTAAYKMRVDGDNIYIAGKNTITTYFLNQRKSY